MVNDRRIRISLINSGIDPKEVERIMSTREDDGRTVHRISGKPINVSGEFEKKDPGSIAANPSIDTNTATRAASMAIGGDSTALSKIGQGAIILGKGNPYALGAGLGLQVLGASAQRRREQKELEARMKVERIERQQRALQNLMSLSQNMRL